MRLVDPEPGLSWKSQKGEAIVAAMHLLLRLSVFEPLFNGAMGSLA
jgi:hypothetical protein